MRTVAALLALFAAACGSLASGRGQDAHAAEPEQATPSYPNSASGLESMFGDMMELQKRGDQAALAPYFRSFVLPHAEDWFLSEFGDHNCNNPNMRGNDCMGPRLARAYASKATALPAAAAMTARDLIDEGLTNFEAVNYTERCPLPLRIVPENKFVAELSVTPYLMTVLSKLARDHEPVYVLWAWGEGNETMIGFFVYFQGAFRYVGQTQPMPFEEFVRNTEEEQTHLARLAPAGDLTEEVLNVRPAIRNPDLVQRTVVLEVRIGKDGKVSEASYVRGPEGFKEDAIESVKKRNFGPQSIFGIPAQLNTCMNVDPRH
jgi:hypothetical protein